MSDDVTVTTVTTGTTVGIVTAVADAGDVATVDVVAAVVAAVDAAVDAIGPVGPVGVVGTVTIAVCAGELLNKSTLCDIELDGAAPSLPLPILPPPPPPPPSDSPTRSAVEIGEEEPKDAPEDDATEDGTLTRIPSCCEYIPLSPWPPPFPPLPRVFLLCFSPPDRTESTYVPAGTHHVAAPRPFNTA
jgi:hypothetical protein